MTAAELTSELGILSERVDNLRRELEASKAAIQRLEAVQVGTQQEVVLVRQRLDEATKRSEKWDNRVWTLIGLFVGSILSLAGSLIVNALRK